MSVKVRKVELEFLDEVGRKSSQKDDSESIPYKNETAAKQQQVSA